MTLGNTAVTTGVNERELRFTCFCTPTAQDKHRADHVAVAATWLRTAPDTTTAAPGFTPTTVELFLGDIVTMAGGVVDGFGV